jgi:hypothetical protein
VFNMKVVLKEVKNIQAESDEELKKILEMC